MYSCGLGPLGGAVRKLIVTGLWLVVCALPSLALHVIGWKFGGTRGDQTPSVLMWLAPLCGLATSSVYRKALAATPDVKARPPDERRLEHLRRSLAPWHCGAQAC